MAIDEMANESGVVTFTAANNAVLARTGPGTALGDALRQYWVPALLSEELPHPDSVPVRVRLLGQDLVAFRDSDGRVGLLDEHCPHRGASLFFGRNNGGGLQCVYHGWTFDVHGTCVESPTCPHLAGDPALAQRAYPVHEAGGLIFAYLGPLGDVPPVPDLGWLKVGDGARYVSKRYQPCHWLQALEVDIDSAHVAYLHREDLIAQADQRLVRTMLEETAPSFDIDETDYGLRLSANRPSGPGTVYRRINHWLVPWYTVVPADSPDGLLGLHAWVPIDDESCWVIGLMWHNECDLAPEQRRLFTEGRGGIFPELQAPGSYVTRRNLDNDYQIDRVSQRLGRSWTGVTGNQEQDDLITASMGRAYDRTRERLVETDAAVIATRQMLLRIADDHAAGRPLLGREARGFDVPSVFFELPTTADWRAEAMTLMTGKQVPDGEYR